MVIAGKRILTNAHVVNHASQVFVQPGKSSEKLAAKVEAMAPGIDLANRNLKHMVEVIRDTSGEFIEFTFYGNETDSFVFKRKEALDATEEILSDNGIREQCSPDIASIWKPKK